jgi:Domain of unknown function (DU1801)
MTLKTIASTASFEDFLNDVTDEQKRADCLALLKLFEKITGETAKMWGPSIVGFGQYSYTRSDNKSYDFMATGFSPRARNLTIYNLPGYTEDPELMSKLGKYKTGRSCLYVKSLADIDIVVLEKILSAGYRKIVGKHIDYNSGMVT